MLAQQLLNWATMGCLYALFALGFSLIFGILKVIHFSHGDVAMTAPFLCLALLHFVSAPGAAPALLAVAVLVLAVVAVGGLGWGLDRTIIRRFRDAPPLMALVATVALGIMVREAIRHLYPEGSNPHAFPNIAPGASLTGKEGAGSLALTIIAATALISGLLYLFLYRTRIGLRTRAVSEDPVVARILGIKDGQVFGATFFIASAIGATAAVLMSSYVGMARFDFGILVGLLGFSAAVIGGLGSMPGAIVGGLIIAGVETLAQSVIPGATPYRLALVFGLVMLVLIVRPTGLFGRALIEKV